MADSEDNPPLGEGKDDDVRILARRIVFEMRIVLESIAIGLETLAEQTEALFIRDEIGVLKKLAEQARECIEGFAEVVDPKAHAPNGN
jgi:hypothetical protein